MFCPVCWKEYPKGFLKCEACNAELTHGKPEGHEHTHEPKPEQKPSGPAGSGSDKK